MQIDNDTLFDLESQIMEALVNDKKTLGVDLWILSSMIENIRDLQERVLTIENYSY